MKKKLGLLVALALFVTLPFANDAKKLFQNKKEIIVDYIVDENGKPNVVYIENNASPRKLEKAIRDVEQMTYITSSVMNQIFSIKVKV